MYRITSIGLLMLVAFCCLSCHVPDTAEDDGNAAASNFERKDLDPAWSLRSAGPWGELEYRRFFLPLPKAWLDGHPEGETQAWHTPGFTPKELHTIISASNLTPQEKALWRTDCQVDATKDGSIIHPSVQFRKSLQPESRAALYLWLAQFPENPTLAFPFCYSPNAFHEWMTGNTLPDELLEAIKTLSYPAAESICFADLDLIEDQVSSREQRIQLLSLLYRHPYCDVRLRIDKQTDLNAVASYWGEGERTDRVKRKLLALLGNQKSTYVPLVEILPPLPRSLLNTFPTAPADSNQPQRDCYWTAFNFFNRTPDDRLHEAEFMESVLTRYHDRVGKPRYGDILFLVDASGRPFHSAIYLADNLVFTKNGGHFTQPWVIMQLSDMRACYPLAKPAREAYYRYNPAKAHPKST